tara:strand:- start:1446 stop:2099 length:654 start_codon:yes stop_codon:yes gene_type:complete
MTSNFENELKHLGEFWEKIEFPNGVHVGEARSKKLLWENYLSDYFTADDFKDKSVLDMGCNAGGNLIELSKMAPRRIVGIETNGTFFNQAQFVVKAFGIHADVLQYRFGGKKDAEIYSLDLGRFDVVFCLGLIYHLSFATNLEILRYIRQTASRCILSTQLFDHKKRPDVDWEVSKEGTLNLLKEAGFSGYTEIYEKKETETWDALTNSWYIEANMG